MMTNTTTTTTTTEAAEAAAIAAEATLPPVSWFDMTYEQRWSPSSLDMAAQVWALSNVAHLLELQSRLSPDLKDYPLNHPLEVARCYVDAARNVDVAEDTFRAMVAWRQSQGIDHLLLGNSAAAAAADNHSQNIQPSSSAVATPLMQRYYPSCFLDGVDRDGDAIWLDTTGRSDCLAVLRRYGPVRFRNYTLWIREQGLRGAFAREYERRHGVPPARVTVVLDMRGLCRRHLHAALIPPLEEGIRILQDVYGGMAKRILVINAPFVFRIVWGIAQHFCNDALKKTIILCNVRNSQATLDKYIDREVLPPCICQEGRGRPGFGMPSDLRGGVMPASDALQEEEDEDDRILPDLKHSGSSTETVMSCDSFSYDTESTCLRASPSCNSTITDMTGAGVGVSVRAKSLLRGNYHDNQSMVLLDSY